jgi:hypothetical protein
VTTHTIGRKISARSKGRHEELETPLSVPGLFAVMDLVLLAEEPQGGGTKANTKPVMAPEPQDGNHAMQKLFLSVAASVPAQ